MSQLGRTARNQALFREANEILRRAAAAGRGDGERRWPFICECADPGCLRELRLTLAEYATVRDEPRTFAVAPGHEAAELEDVVGRGDRFWLVRKRSDVV